MPSISLVRLTPGAAGTYAKVVKHQVNVAVRRSASTIEGDERIRSFDTIDGEMATGVGTYC